jgi:hypothetical protein
MKSAQQDTRQLGSKQLANVACVFGPHVDHPVDRHIWSFHDTTRSPVDAEALVWCVNDEHHIATLADDVPEILRSAIRLGFANKNSSAAQTAPNQPYGGSRLSSPPHVGSLQLAGHRKARHRRNMPSIIAAPGSSEQQLKRPVPIDTPTMSANWRIV